MSLAPGTALGSYQIVAPLGAGGMGEVYRARDMKLGRDVAIKILPEGFADNPDRVARFQREAQVLAALNHPHIAAIYGLEEAAGARFLILEFVDGRSLAERVTKGLAIVEALAIARQIVDALEAAHDKGIIHRDLKPANIMLTADGQVKVLDFGLAKVEAGEAGRAGEAGGLTDSPTLTFAATQAGVILGTAAYMSPEQARGRPTDKRSDVWAFGCVLFEMLAGKRAFEGEDVSDTLAAILRGEPDWSALPANTPPPVRRMLERCLLKDRKARVPDLAVVRFMMDDPPVASAPVPAAVVKAPTRASWPWKAAAALFVLTTIAAGSGWYSTRSTVPSVTRFSVLPPDGQTFAINQRSGVQAAISPDGRTLAFTARDPAGKTLLWVRPIDSLAAQPLPGTETASSPFWSPDSRFIAYSTPGKLMKIPATGGPVQTLCALSGVSIVARGGSWNRDGVIVFSNGPGQPLHRVSSAGGQSSPVGQLGAGQLAPVYPSFLPDGRHVLFYDQTNGRDLTGDGVHVVSLDTAESKSLVAADTGAVYAPEAGVLLLVRQGTLLAQKFDPRSLSMTGEAVPVVERVESAAIPGVVAFSVSTNGTLAYGVGSDTGGGEQLVWVDRQGKSLSSVGPEANYRGVDLSPDGTRIAAHRHDGNGGDIWITDVPRGTSSRFTFDTAQDNHSPIWSPDGSFIAFNSNRAGTYGVYRKPSNSSRDEERLFETNVPAPVLFSWSPDGRALVYSMLDRKTSQDLWLLPLSGDRKPVPLVRTPFEDLHGQISPDGKWLAYWSNETGRNEVYVQPFPQGAGKWQVSSAAGVFPRWRRDGRELFYMTQSSGGKMAAVATKTDGVTFEAGTPTELFDTRYVNHPVGHPFHAYAVSADGQRFLIPRAPTTAMGAASAAIVVVVNWATALEKK